MPRTQTSPLQRVKAAKATKASQPAPPPPEAPAVSTVAPQTASPAAGGKLGAMVELLRRPEGADLAQLMAATGWQAHSVRGALAGALKKRGFEILSEKAAEGPRRYRIPQTEGAAPAAQEA